MLKRYLNDCVLEDIKEKMVFIGGPRQVGKTTLAKYIANKYFPKQSQYLNWDNRQDRRNILDSQFKGESNLIIFDEIHKYRKWKNYIKGEWDKNDFKVIVTGSSKLDVFRKGGDSLLGRYFYYRLHPLSVAELINKKNFFKPFSALSFDKRDKGVGAVFNRLLSFGGFPEMYIKKQVKNLRRWHNNRINRLVKEDIRDIENIRDLSSLEILVQLLPEKVGSLLSINSLTEDLQVTHKTLSSWMDILERFYYHFRIYPYQSTVIRSLRKEPKMYLWDWSELENENSKLENIVASALLKFCHFIYDTQGHKIELKYLRDRDQREVDFIVTVNKKPWFCVEVKKSTTQISKSLHYFRKALKIPFSYQVVDKSNVDFKKDGVRVLSADTFMTGLV